ncbi:MAG: insulinase family protein [Candidatus Pacebacteria bacterium]|nr:insulinase family protein [Candidatus Paceibacterota bacterium]MBP9851635.1 insulinase family protein [Candidatus Paceibacterota bacterium]
MKISTHELKNGVRLVSVFMPESLSQTTMILQRIGSNNETDEDAGIAHFLEHMCFKGTTKRPSALQIVRDFDALGAHINAFTSNQYTGFYAKTATLEFAESLEILSDIYLNSIFPDSELQKEKGVICDEIRMYQDEPRSRVDQLFESLVFPNVPAGRPVIGSEETVRGMTRERLLNWHRKNYTPASTVIVVAGGIEHESAVAEIEKYFNDIPKADPAPIIPMGETYDGRVKILKDSSAQVHMLFGARSFGYEHPDRMAAGTLATILGGTMSSRLFQKIREELGYGYYVFASQAASEGYGVFFSGTGVDPKGIPVVLPAIVAEFQKIASEPVSDLELALAKKYRKSSMLMGFEDNENVATYYGSAHLFNYPLELPEERARKIDAVTKDDILRVAKHIFKPENFRLAAVGPIDDEKSLEDFLPAINL